MIQLTKYVCKRRMMCLHVHTSTHTANKTHTIKQKGFRQFIDTSNVQKIGFKYSRIQFLYKIKYSSVTSQPLLQLLSNYYIYTSFSFILKKKKKTPPPPLDKRMSLLTQNLK